MSSSTDFETPEAYVGRVLATWVERMKLTHWDVAIDWSMSCEPPSDASVTSEDCYDRARIRVNLAEFLGWSRRETNVTIVHELMHVALRDLEQGVRSVEPVLKGVARDLFVDRFEHEAEGFVERTAHVLVDLGGEV